MVDEEGRAQHRGRARQDRRHELILAAYGRIASIGLEGLRTRDVAADVGVNVATLHYYFPTKEALIQAVVAYTTDRFSATLPAVESPSERLRGHLTGLRHLLREEPELFAVLCEVMMRAARDPEIAAIFRQTDDPWYAFVRDLLRLGSQEGSLNPDLDPDDVAALVIAAIKGVSLPGVDPQQRLNRIDQTFRQLEAWLGLRR